MAATFHKLPNGQWGISFIGKRPEHGQAVKVSKRFGGTSRVHVDQIIFSFDFDHEYICSIIEQTQAKKA